MKAVFFPAGFLLGLTLFTTPTWAQEAASEGEVRKLGSTITGNQEQPKVLYIVPWKAARDEAAIPYQPIVGQTDSVFDHIERDEHRRQLKFLQQLSISERAISK